MVMVKVIRLIKKWVMNEEMEKSETNGRGVDEGEEAREEEEERRPRARSEVNVEVGKRLQKQS